MSEVGKERTRLEWAVKAELIKRLAVRIEKEVSREIEKAEAAFGLDDGEVVAYITTEDDGGNEPAVVLTVSCGENTRIEETHYFHSCEPRGRIRNAISTIVRDIASTTADYLASPETHPLRPEREVEFDGFKQSAVAFMGWCVAAQKGDATTEAENRSSLARLGWKIGPPPWFYDSKANHT